MSTSPFTFAVEQVRTALATESTFRVLSIYRDSNDDKVNTYPYIDMGSFPEVYQSGTPIGLCRFPFIIKCSGNTDADPNGTGKGTELCGLIIKRVMKAIGDYNCEAVARNNDGDYYTNILSMAVTDHDGHYDDAKGKVHVGVAALITVYIARI